MTAVTREPRVLLVEPGFAMRTLEKSVELKLDLHGNPFTFNAGVYGERESRVETNLLMKRQ